ncbi:MAG: pentapeptide repeat-containing protein [Eubacterium sp.]
MKKKELNKILDEHKKWLETNGEQGQRADLSSANLRSADLSSADLRSADLRYADLSSANLRYADLRYADLSSANLRYANLRYADLSDADLDYSAFPLWCGGLNVHIDDKQATQLLYHIIRNVQFSKNTSDDMKKLLATKSLIEQANKFHRVDECGKIEMVGEE